MSQTELKEFWITTATMKQNTLFLFRQEGTEIEINIKGVEFTSSKILRPEEKNFIKQNYIL